MSFVPALGYTIGIAVMGWVGWILGGIKQDLVDIGIHETGTVWSFLLYLWTGMFVVYLVFGGYYVIRMYNEKRYSRGGMM